MACKWLIKRNADTHKNQLIMNLFITDAIIAVSTCILLEEWTNHTSANILAKYLWPILSHKFVVLAQGWRHKCVGQKKLSLKGYSQI